MKNYLSFFQKEKKSQSKTTPQKKKNPPNKTAILFLFLSVPLLCISFFTLFLFNRSIEKETKALMLHDAFEVQPAAYPKMNNVFPFLLGNPLASAEGIIVIDNDSKVVLYKKNEGEEFPMASTVKLMTALVALDVYRPSDTLTIYSDNVEPAVVGFEKGEHVDLQSMLYGMLLPSGNDAALAIAQNYPGGLTAFVGKMNEKANALHLVHTHFADPAGLDDANNTTPLELARLTAVALANPVIAQIVSTKQKDITTLDTQKTYQLYNLNKLLGVDGVVGVKTGFTPAAGGVLTTARIKDGHTLLFVVMRSEDRFLDTQNLLSVFDNNLTYLPTGQ